MQSVLPAKQTYRDARVPLEFNLTNPVFIRTLPRGNAWSLELVDARARSEGPPRLLIYATWFTLRRPLSPAKLATYAAPCRLPFPGAQLETASTSGQACDLEARCPVNVAGVSLVRSVRLMRRENRLYYVQVSVAPEMVAVADGFLASLRVRDTD